MFLLFQYKESFKLNGITFACTFNYKIKNTLRKINIKKIANFIYTIDRFLKMKIVAVVPCYKSSNIALKVIKILLNM